MPDTTLRLRYPTGANLYTQIEGGTGIWNGTAYVAFANSGWATYATSTPETPPGSGRYVCQFPLTSPAGNYSWAMYLGAGGTPAVGDVPVGTGSGYWDGTTFGGASMVTGSVSLPTVPPTGYGNLSGTTGTVIITQDYGGVGELSATDVYGAGIGGATVTAFLAADWATNGRNATPKAQVTTTASGQWATGMILGLGSYVLLYSDRGYKENPVTITIGS